MDGALIPAVNSGCHQATINDLKSLNDTKLQIVIVMEPDMTVQNLGSPALFPSSEAAGTRERRKLPTALLLIHHHDRRPRAILDFGF